MQRVGGADSDVMVDMIVRCGAKDRTDFVFFNTGLEYRATLEHLDALEKRYDIRIERVRPVKSIPQSCREHGVPFRSKDFSQKIYAAQHHGFRWEDESLEVLSGRYQHLSGALRWWCNYGSFRSYTIQSAAYLKEFIMQNPPDFPISDECCTYAKKLPSRRYEKAGGYDLKCMGVRKEEGGLRGTAYKTCYTEGDGMDHFRPVWWLRNCDKQEYCEYYGIIHSRCYTEYGMQRTGCVGCPFAMDFEDNLERMKKFEPHLYTAAVNIFGKSYEYTRQYKKFRDEMKSKAKSNR